VGWQIVVWAKLLAWIAFLLGRNAGEATQQATDAKATTDALEKRAKTDDEVVRAGDAVDRRLLGKWSSGS